MNNFNMPVPPRFPDPLADIRGLQREMADALGDLFAEQAAMRGVLVALATSHPEPERLVEAYLEHMDLLVEHIDPKRIAKFRTAAQQWRDLLLHRTGQQPPS